METQNNNVPQESQPQAVAVAQVPPESGGNLFDAQAQPNPQSQQTVAQAQAPVVFAQPVASAQVLAQTPAQPWNQQPQAQVPQASAQQGPKTEEMLYAIEQAIVSVNQRFHNVNLKNFITIRNKYSNGDLVMAHESQPQANLVGFGLCMNKGSKNSLKLSTSTYNRLVCDIADAIANLLGNWNGVDVNPTNASAVDVFDRNMVQQRPRRQEPQYQQPQQYVQPQYGYAPQPQYAPQQGYGYAQYAQPQQPQYAPAPQYGYAPVPQQPQYGYHR